MNKLDFQKFDDDTVMHNVNFEKYDTKKENWYNLEQLFCNDVDFVDLMFKKLTGKLPTQIQKDLFLKSLMLVSMGTGYHPPSVLIPKLVSSVTKDKRFAVINGLIGGLTSLGTHHLGAIYDAMNVYYEVNTMLEDFFRQNKKIDNKDIVNIIDEFVEKKIENHEKIPGFGHPVYDNDPRTEIIIGDIEKYYTEHVYFKIYDALLKKLNQKKNISSNIDGILSLSFLILGFEPAHGVYLNFVSRSLNMVCHILEEFPKNPFSFLNEAVPLESRTTEVNDKPYSKFLSKEMKENKTSIII